MKKRFKVLLPLILAVVLLVLPASNALADANQDVTVTCVPEFIAIANAPATWTMNGITGSGVCQVDTIYYANPLGDTTAPSSTVADGECRFTITNTSTVAIDLTCTMSNFSGGDTMDNSDDGTNGATTYGAHSWFSGDSYPGSKVIIKTTGSSVGKNGLAAETNIKWGAEVETRTNAWASGNSLSSTLNIAATAD